MKDISRYFKRRNILVEHIISAYSKNQALIICMESGDEFSTSILLYELISYLPKDEFIEIRRGTIVRISAIISISDDGLYTLIDGKSYQGRKRNLRTHKNLRDELRMKNNILIKPIKISQSFLEKCSILDEMQLAYCVIELVFDENGHGLDFIFRYCNK